MTDFDKVVACEFVELTNVYYSNFLLPVSRNRRCPFCGGSFLSWVYDSDYSVSFLCGTDGCITDGCGRGWSLEFDQQVLSALIHVNGHVTVTRLTIDAAD